MVWRWGQLQINETGAENGIKRHEKGTKMGAKIDAKSIRNRAGAAEAFEEGPWRQNSPTCPRFGFQFWDPFRAKIEKTPSEKASNNQCKTMLTFEAKGGPKMRPTWVRKSRIFFNGPRWVVLRKSSFYCSKTMVLEDSGFQKSTQINEKCMRKTGSEKGLRN